MTTTTSPSVPSHRRKQSSTSDDWHDGSLVEDFSEVIDGAAESSLPGTEVPSTNLPDWDDWQTQTQTAGPSTTNSKTDSPLPLSFSTTNQADEDFFSALEKAGNHHTSSKLHKSPQRATSRAPSSKLLHPQTIESPDHPPSPPIIDLRPEERRIRQRDLQSITTSAAGGDGEEDWFAAFERDPLSKSPVKGRSMSEMDTEQMDSMREARNSPMIVSIHNETAVDPSTSSDYFGSSAKTKRNPSLPRLIQKPSHASTAPQTSGSWWGSIRGLGSNLAQHAVDLIDPGIDFGDEELKIARKMGAIDINSKPNTPLASQSGTPVRGMTPVPPPGNPQPTAAQPAKQTHPPPLRSASLPASRFVSGAPGVDFARLEPHWNTGHWSLDEEDAPSSSLGRNGTEKSVAEAVAAASKPQKPYRDPLPVHLTGRREETTPVVTGMHSSHLQPYLPPRLKLGRTWRLLYSSDQDGVSLETLYHKVKVGMNPRPSRPTSSTLTAHSLTGFGSDRQDGWLRGSSSATKAALGADMSSSFSSSSSHPIHAHKLGSGITSISDAGLVLAIRDADDQVFGAFVNEGLKSTKGYYGNGDCFLWRTVQPRQGTPYIKAYPTTLLNNYHILSTHDYLSLGGGIDGRYGLWIDSSFERGVSSRSETYGNEVLCDDREREGGQGREEDAGREGSAEREKARGEVKFEPVIVEVWAVGID